MLIHEEVGDVPALMVNFVLWRLIKEAGAQGRRHPEDLLLEVGVEKALVVHDDRRSQEKRVVDGFVELLMNDGKHRRFHCRMVWVGPDHKDFDTDASMIKEE